jgi:hypothetical protein
LNQNSRNSSRPSSSEAPWVGPDDEPISVYDKADGKTVNEVEEDTTSGKEEVPSENADASCPRQKNLRKKSDERERLKAHTANRCVVGIACVAAKTD